MFHLIKDTFREWREDGAPRLAAALIIAIAGLAGGRDAAQTQTMAQVEELLGIEGSEFVQGMIESASRPATGVTATVIGAITLFPARDQDRLEGRLAGCSDNPCLFRLGKFLIGLYLGRSEVGTTFGGAGSLANLLI